MSTALVDLAPGWCGIGDEAAPDLTSQLRILGDLGLGGIEVRTVDGLGLHELDPAQVADVAAEVGASGLVVPVVDTPIGNWATTVSTDLRAELAVLEASVTAAAALGCSRLRVMSWPSDGRVGEAWAGAVIHRMTRLVDEAERLGVVLLHENCAGWGGLGPRETVRLVDAVDSPALRLVMDLGNGLAHGYDGFTFLQAVLPWVDHVHVKDGRSRGAGADATFTVPGRGDVPVADCVELLEAGGYTGWYSLEPHVAHIPHLGLVGERHTLETGFAECVSGFRAIWQEVGHRVAA